MGETARRFRFLFPKIQSSVKKNCHFSSPFYLTRLLNEKTKRQQYRHSNSKYHAIIITTFITNNTNLMLLLNPLIDSNTDTELTPLGEKANIRSAMLTFYANKSNNTYVVLTSRLQNINITNTMFTSCRNKSDKTNAMLTSRTNKSNNTNTMSLLYSNNINKRNPMSLLI